MRPSPPDNIWTLFLPAPEDTPIPLFEATNDTGKFVKAILTHRDKLLGKQILAATDYYTLTDVINTFKEVKPEAGKKAKFVRQSEEEYEAGLAGLGLPKKAQVELYENMAFMHDYGYFGKASLADSLAVSFVLCQPPTLFFELTWIGYRYLTRNPQR